MWNTIQGVISFAIFPATFVFLIYAAGRMIFLQEWKLFLIALALFLLSVLASIVISVMD